MNDSTRSDSPGAGFARVSVVIPSYNRAHCLQQTVGSVLDQTYPAHEIIIVDDGSRDNTEQVALGFPPPVRYVKQQNGGVSAARNTGIRNATGDYFAFLDADDVWLRNKLEVQMAAHAQFPEAGWSATDHFTTDLTGKTIPELDGMARTSTVFGDVGMEPDEFFAQSLKREKISAAGREIPVYVGDLFALAFEGNVIFPSGSMVRRSLVESAGMFDPAFRYAEETEFFHRMAAAAPVLLVRDQLFQWRRGREDTLVSSSNTAALVRNALESLDRASRLRQLTPEIRGRYERHKRRLLKRIAYAHLSELETGSARAALTQARAAGEPWIPSLLPMYLASLMPAVLLRGAHSLKRRARGMLR